jgi:hypothetical protein
MLAVGCGSVKVATHPHHQSPHEACHEDDDQELEEYPQGPDLRAFHCGHRSGEVQERGPFLVLVTGKAANEKGGHFFKFPLAFSAS